MLLIKEVKRSRKSSTNIGNSTQNFLTFSFNPFCDTGAKFERSYLDPLPNIGLEAKAPLKKSWFLWSNPYKIGVIKNFHRNAKVTKL